MSGPERIAIELVYPRPEQQLLLKLQVAPGTTIAQAIDLSGLLPQLPPEWERRVGIFGRLRDPQTIVSAGDRIEIYRELLADPKDVRRARVKRERRQQR